MKQQALQQSMKDCGGAGLGLMAAPQAADPPLWRLCGLKKEAEHGGGELEGGEQIVAAANL
jgi:hypothetical protein